MFRKILNYLIFERRKEIPFLVFATFLITFGLSRLMVYLIFNGILPEWLMLDISGVHIHHLNYGIFFLAISGFLSLNNKNHPNLTYILAIIYGLGLGLAFDEFGMWLHLEDNYWIRQSYDAIIFISALFLNIVYFPHFWEKMGREFYCRIYCKIVRKAPELKD